MNPLKWWVTIRNMLRRFYSRKVEQHKTEDAEEIRSMWRRVIQIEMQARSLRREPWRPR